MKDVSYIGPDGVNYGKRWIYWLISILLIVSIQNIYYSFSYIDLQDFTGSEFLINYEGGFVRRGLLGEGIYLICKTTGWSPRIPIFLLCIAAYAFVFCFFLKRFLREGYSWWFLFSPLFLGFTEYVIRKDFIECSMLIFCLLLLRERSPGFAKRCCVAILTILAIFFHEAFIFWGFPIIGIILISSVKRCKWGYANIIIIIAILAAFILQVIFKGSQDATIRIVDSWNEVPGCPTLYYDEYNSIGALGWELVDTIRYHIKCNIVGYDVHPIGLFWQPIFALAVYYFCTNFIFVLHRKDMSHVAERKLAFSCVYLLSMICMIPMFTILSCDYARLYQYQTIAACSALTIIDYRRLLSLFPSWYLKIAKRINSVLDQYLPNGRKVMVIMLLFLAISPYSFSFTRNFTYSAIGKVIIFLTNHLLLPYE